MWKWRDSCFSLSTLFESSLVFRERYGKGTGVGAFFLLFWQGVWEVGGSGESAIDSDPYFPRVEEGHFCIYTGLNKAMVGKAGGSKSEGLLVFFSLLSCDFPYAYREGAP